MTDTTGQSWPAPIQHVTRALRSPTLAMIVRALAERPLTYPDLLMAVYRGNEPTWAEACLRQTIYHSDAKLHPFGWHIQRAKRGRGRCALTLVPLDARNPARAAARAALVHQEGFAHAS
ncbi:hypothetical protein [Roseicyclus amphidinii]|uniref:hypothetical protein n=1 Tax=Roseicyclus amphidinii TaxID=3034232 RepID=UPI0024E1553B|nr:hypothetical protein [Roseicyclus sp. Amp-Y-6]